VKSTDRTILMVVVGLAAIAAVWFLLIAPKREEATSLSGEVDELRIGVEQAEQTAAAAEAAKKDYAPSYHRLVVLGKAAPADDDTASLFVELDQVAHGSGVDLQGITLSQGGTTAPPAPAAQTTTDQSQEQASEEPAAPESTPAASVPATEAAAATLPIGAAVGPAGLPVMPYELTLKGNYFQLSDFIDGLQRLINSKHGRLIVDGRLVTIDDFTFEGDSETGFPELDATLNVTTFLSPVAQGLTAGATPTAPAPTPPASESSAVPASQTSVTP
jgi:Tfp pilus assembly protein PilO